MWLYSKVALSPQLIVLHCNKHTQAGCLPWGLPGFGTWMLGAAMYFCASAPVICSLGMGPTTVSCGQSGCCSQQSSSCFVCLRLDLPRMCRTDKGWTAAATFALPCCMSSLLAAGIDDCLDAWCCPGPSCFSCTGLRLLSSVVGVCDVCCTTTRGSIDVCPACKKSTGQPAIVHTGSQHGWLRLLQEADCSAVLTIALVRWH